MKWCESETLEFKKTTMLLKECVISACSMLNKHHQGTIYFGVKDDGSICGQDIGKKTTATVSHELRNNLKPIPVISISTERMEDRDVIKVEVSGEDTPYSAYGRYYTRVDDSDIVMDSHQLWTYFESKTMTYAKWEESETEYGPEQINEELLIDYVRTANDTGRLNYVYRNQVEALTKLNLLTANGKLNRAGYYLFGNDGPLLLREAVFPTDDRRNFSDIKQFRGNILECIHEGQKYIQNNIHYPAEILGNKRVETPEIPLAAIREIVINSFSHCHYQEGDSNEISITRSKVRIYNPGGIINNASPVEFASGQMGSKIRNPLIATVLFKNGMIDQFGTGFDRTFRTCAENSVDVDYQNDEYGFTFIFSRKTESVMRNSVHESGYEYQVRRRSDLDDEILTAIANNNYITIPELSETLGKSIPTIQRHLTKLVDEHVVERVGARKNGYWKICER